MQIAQARVQPGRSCATATQDLCMSPTLNIPLSSNLHFLSPLQLQSSTSTQQVRQSWSLCEALLCPHDSSTSLMTKHPHSFFPTTHPSQTGEHVFQVPNGGMLHHHLCKAPSVALASYSIRLDIAVYHQQRLLSCATADLHADTYPCCQCWCCLHGVCSVCCTHVRS